MYRSAFGKAALRSERFYSHCSEGGFCSASARRSRRSLPKVFKRNVQAVGSRLEHEARASQVFSSAPIRTSNVLPLTGPPMGFQVGAGYIKTCAVWGSGLMPIVASKLVRYDAVTATHMRKRPILVDDRA